MALIALGRWNDAATSVGLGLVNALIGTAQEIRAKRKLDAIQLLSERPAVVRRDGQTSSKPCAEVVLTVRAYGRLVDAGLMPLLSFKDQDLVRLPTFQSIASPSAPLAGRWGGA